jgi:hypothetical protein
MPLKLRRSSKVKSVPEIASVRCAVEMRHAAQGRHVDPGVVVARLAPRLVAVLVAVGEQLDPARVEGRHHLGAEGALALLSAEEVASLLFEEFGLDPMGELHALAGALVVEGKLLAAVPVRVVEARQPVAAPGLEIPHQLDAGLRVLLAVDLLDREGRPP